MEDMSGKKAFEGAEEMFMNRIGSQEFGFSDGQQKELKGAFTGSLLFFVMMLSLVSAKESGRVEGQQSIAQQS